MMAGLASSGVWLFVMLTDAVMGYPKKNALDSHRGYDAPPGPGWGEPPSGFAQAETGFSPPSYPDLYEPPPYSQPAAEMRPVPALYAPDMYPAHVYSEHGGRSPPQSGPQVHPNQGNWAVPPPSPLHYEPSSPEELGFASEPVPPDYPYPPGPFFPHPQPGELSYEEKSFEQGNYNSESEEQRPPAPPFQYFAHPALSRLPISSPLVLGTLLDRLQFGYPNIDYMLLTRNRPPGTYTFSTNNYKHGKNQWHDSHYIGAPDVPREELDTKQPRPPVPQRVGYYNYGVGEKLFGLNQPYR